MFVEAGIFEYHPGQRERFKAGVLWQDWARQYPDIFDDLDRDIARNQAPLGYHFFEWLGAIFLYNSTGYLSLVEKYEFKNHARKHAIMSQLVSAEVFDLIQDHAAYQRTQCPDLLAYAPDMSDWFFCEVKGPRDRLQAIQKEFFEALARASGKKIRLIRFREASRITS